MHQANSHNYCKADLSLHWSRYILECVRRKLYVLRIKEARGRERLPCKKILYQLYNHVGQSRPPMNLLCGRVGCA